MKKLLLISLVAGAALGFAKPTMAQTLPMPTIEIVKTADRTTPFSFGGGLVKYTYTVTNPSNIALHNVSVTDNGCRVMTYHDFGDINNDNRLSYGEKRMYTCQTRVFATTKSISMAQGEGNGYAVSAFGSVNVLVNTGSTYRASTHRAAAILNLACVQSGVQARELALQDAWKNYSSITQIALTVRATALSNAWTMTTKHDMQTAITNAWHAFNKNVLAAKKVNQKANSAARATFRSVSKTCGADASYGDQEHGVRL